MLDDSVLTSVFPGEVITRALVRDVQLPAGAGTMALITLDNGHDHTRPNTFGPAGLIALRDALDEVAGRAETGDIAAVGVTGKPFIFAAAADLAVAALIRSRDEALAVGGLGHDVLRRFGELGVPSFAFVNGAALGGGLEPGVGDAEREGFGPGHHAVLAERVLDDDLQRLIRADQARQQVGAAPAGQQAEEALGERHRGHAG